MDWEIVKNVYSRIGHSNKNEQTIDVHIQKKWMNFTNMKHHEKQSQNTLTIWFYLYEVLEQAK